MKTIDVGFNAARLCEAIARIGYEPYTAIMDLVDNSVTAKARNIRISLYLAPGKSLKARNSVRRYQIVDNGVGMDDAGIEKAFALGADVAYGENSLSKYGLGLKSAGLSLGSRIIIISKRQGVFSDRYTFDKSVIVEHGKFVVTVDALSDEQKNSYELLLPDSAGTIVEIEGSETVNHPSPNSTVARLKERLGVVYFSFLTSTDHPLEISTRVCPDGAEEMFEPVVPRDMLFMDSPNFKLHWNPESYDYSSPYLVLDEAWKIHSVTGSELTPINVKAVVFPQARMAENDSPLDPELRKVVSSYRIARENKGFYIYRNGRLIRWGDDLEGLIKKDDTNLRIRMDLGTDHDDVLHVDVTKQRLEVDDENLKKLQGIIGKARKIAEDVAEHCKKKLEERSGNEGAAFNATVTNVAEDDPDQAATGDPPTETQVRRRRRAAEGTRVREALSEEKKDEGLPETTEDGFRKIVYSGKVPYGHVWEPHYDATNGTFVCVSKHHPFYQEMLNRMPENNAQRLCAEALIFAVALGENNVRDNFDEITPEQLDRLFNKFHKNVGNWLSDWVTENTNILGS